MVENYVALLREVDCYFKGKNDGTLLTLGFRKSEASSTISILVEINLEVYFHLVIG